jgi:hypothetical protein
MIGRFIRKILLNRMDKRAAVKWIEAETKKEIPQPEQNHFMEVIERELDSLHEGNIARYRLRLSEFKDWKSTWH